MSDLTLVEAIGRGGYGTVYRGAYRSLPAAVKVRRGVWMAARPARARACAGAALAAAVLCRQRAVHAPGTVAPPTHPPQVMNARAHDGDAVSDAMEMAVLSSIGHANIVQVRGPLGLTSLDGGQRRRRRPRPGRPRRRCAAQHPRPSLPLLRRPPCPAADGAAGAPPEARGSGLTPAPCAPLSYRSCTPASQTWWPPARRVRARPRGSFGGMGCRQSKHAGEARSLCQPARRRARRVRPH